MKLPLTLLCLVSPVLLGAQIRRTCATAEYHAALEKSFPSLKAFSYVMEEKKTQAAAIVREITGTIVIPVVINVVLKDTSLVTKAQAESQIAVLNEDFSGKNKDLNEVPIYFRPFLSGDTRIRFRLDTLIKFKTDRQRFFINTDSGVVRSAATDPVKFSETGGIPGTEPAHKLNIWVADIYYYDKKEQKDLDLLGFCPTPPVPLEMDGVMIHYRFFGKSPHNEPGYNKGRTATHEVGHYLGLIHIWGDWFCKSDQVDDTPPQRGANYGCNTGKIRDCINSPNGCMYMDFMDCESDECMHLFTAGQAERMRQQLVLYRPGLLVTPGVGFNSGRGWLGNLSFVSGVTQRYNKAFISVSRSNLAESTLVYIKKARDTAWLKVGVMDNVLTTKGLEPGQLYEIKIQSAEHRKTPLADLPSTFFVPSKRLFKKGEKLKILGAKQ